MLLHKPLLCFFATSRLMHLTHLKRLRPLDDDKVFDRMTVSDSCHPSFHQIRACPVQHASQSLRDADIEPFASSLHLNDHGDQFDRN